MRDPNRIPETLAAVERIWRLGQLLENVAAWADQPISEIEEDTVIEEIEQHVSNAVPSGA